MKEELNQLKTRLQEERQRLAQRLKEIDTDLASIGRVEALVTGSDSNNGSEIESTTKAPKYKRKIKRFAKFTFRKAANVLFDDDPEKFWAPREIAQGLLHNGFKTKAKDFGATTRTMLHTMRKNGEINGTRTKDGWLYRGLRNSPVSKEEKQEGATSKLIDIVPSVNNSAGCLSGLKGPV